jgi:hypothetical protein
MNAKVLAAALALLLTQGCGMAEWARHDAAKPIRWPLVSSAGAGARPSVLVNLQDENNAVRDLPAVRSCGLFSRVTGPSDPRGAATDYTLDIGITSDVNLHWYTWTILTLGVLPFGDSEHVTVEAKLLDATGQEVGSWSKTDGQTNFFWIGFLPINALATATSIGGPCDLHNLDRYREAAVENLVANLMVEIDASHCLERKRND